MIFGPILAALIASGVAIFIAVYIYPRQKKIDRDIELRRERRSAYYEFLKEIAKLREAFDALNFSTETQAKESVSNAFSAKKSYERALFLVAVLASQDVMPAIIEGQNDLDRLLTDLQRAIEKIYVDNPGEISGHVVNQRVNSALMDARLAFLRTDESIINAMRVEEFGQLASVRIKLNRP